MKFEGFEKKIKQFVIVIFLSSAQSVYFNHYFCLMCIYRLILIVDHTKSYVEKNTLKIRGHQCGRPQGPSRLSVGIGITKRHGLHISSISHRFAF